MGERVITIDRTHSVLGNHDFVLKDHRDRKARDLIIVQYREKVKLDCDCQGQIHISLLRILALILSGVPIAFDCWCTPERCHGEVLREELSRMAGRCLLPPDEQPQVSPRDSQPEPVALTQALLF